MYQKELLEMEKHVDDMKAYIKGPAEFLKGEGLFIPNLLERLPLDKLTLFLIAINPLRI